jgi:phage terminase large subunit
LINEQKKYRYKADPKTGLMTNTPIDAFNHAWDAIRYWSQYNLKPIRQIDTKFRGAVA